MKMFIVKHTAIRKENKTYGVGEKFPYSDKDKSLLDKGYLTEAKDGPTVAEPGRSTKDVEPKKADEKKKATATKKATTKKKNN